ncbi:PapD-like protein [Lasiosphaeria miniovina]|uniref:PapD-like protein n=1 Tax=Lasiosphaeria miniovina TaxID=1954250 RepID=A0AA40B3K9_9PEZI|nr:PapD-like protein [Lasiosphaeria miniovina]KAK0727006.1 PapD-like protein [Lasiosphaeria miniovina]
MPIGISPPELNFHRPFTVEVAQVLKIKNNNQAPIAFKVKTTAPKQYCVRPNSGRIEPGHEVEVSVLLQAMKQEPPLEARCRDKFLVQSVEITGDKEFTNVAQIWESVDKAAIQEKKIRVSWLLPLDGSHGQQPESVSTPVRYPHSNGVEATPDVAPPAYSSPSEGNVIASSVAISEMDTHDADESPEPTQATFSAPTVAAVKASAVETYEELKDKLSQAESKLASITNEATSGLRQRQMAGSDEKSGGQVQEQAQAVRQSTEGVPVQIAALLCLISFLLAYFLF